GGYAWHRRQLAAAAPVESARGILAAPPSRGGEFSSLKQDQSSLDRPSHGRSSRAFRVCLTPARRTPIIAGGCNLHPQCISEWFVSLLYSKLKAKGEQP